MGFEEVLGMVVKREAVQVALGGWVGVVVVMLLELSWSHGLASLPRSSSGPCYTQGELINNLSVEKKIKIETDPSQAFVS